MLGVADVANGQVGVDGRAEVVLWRDGRKIWGIAAVYDRPRIDGDLPADILAGVEVAAREAADDDEDEDEDYFAAIRALGAHLTGYREHQLIGQPDEAVFEILETPGEAAIWRGFPDALADALSAEGFAMWPALPGGELWYTADTAVAGLTGAVGINMWRESGGIGINGKVAVMWVADIMADLPQEANSADHSERYGTIADCYFGSPAYPLPSFRMSAGDDIAAGVDWVMEYVNGPMAVWFEERSGVADLVAQAKTIWRRSPGVEMVKPRLLRATVAFCAANGHAIAAADLMQWYLTRNQFVPTDSLDRATTFDTWLQDRFSHYAAARSR
ncbi:hypothetical protein ACFYV7_40035 [Nocardia suismassiliense]|uniref:Uncharacterized protein n=1 Tax=Nocardia suismassiliense TaxID=2077092 RepID=A0ABW6R681_9NOCA